MRLKDLSALSKFSALSQSLQAQPQYSEVLTEIINVAHESNIRWRGRSYATSVPSYIINAQKVRKRVSKDERKAMVEDFVNKYRGINAGKFPTASEIKKHVGGSYYTVRQLVQELEHKSRVSSLNRTDEKLLGNELAKEKKSVAESKKVLGSQKTVDNLNETGDGSSRHLEAMGGQWAEKVLPDEGDMVKQQTEEVCHPHLEKLGKSRIEEAKENHSGFVETQIHMLKGETEVSSQTCLEKTVDSKKDKAASESLLEFDGTKHEVKQNQGSPELEDFPRDISRKQDEELPKESTIWASLKSFAGGIMNILRKL